MANTHAKQKLIGFLKQRAWNPVLKASAKRFEGADVKRLERVQRKTAAQNERYDKYRNAGEILQRFRGDLNSQAAKKTDADLHALNLPTQADVAGEFFQLAERLKVELERRPARQHRPHPLHPWHKSKLQDREKAAAELKKEARQGNRAALDTLKKAPAKWAREYAQQITRKRTSRAKKRG